LIALLVPWRFRIARPRLPAGLEGYSCRPGVGARRASQETRPRRGVGNDPETAKLMWSTAQASLFRDLLQSKPRNVKPAGPLAERMKDFVATAVRRGEALDQVFARGPHHREVYRKGRSRWTTSARRALHDPTVVDALVVRAVEPIRVPHSDPIRHRAPQDGGIVVRCPGNEPPSSTWSRAEYLAC